MRAALEELPDEQRRVIELAYFGGFTHSEIAEMLDEPLGTVKGRMRLGLEKLRGARRPGPGARVMSGCDYTSGDTGAFVLDALPERRGGGASSAHVRPSICESLSGTRSRTCRWSPRRCRRASDADRAAAGA